MVRRAGVLGHTGPLFLAWGLDWVPMPCLSHIGRLGALLPHGILHALPVGAGASGASLGLRRPSRSGRLVRMWSERPMGAGRGCGAWVVC